MDANQFLTCSTVMASIGRPGGLGPLSFVIGSMRVARKIARLRHGQGLPMVAERMRLCTLRHRKNE